MRDKVTGGGIYIIKYYLYYLLAIIMKGKKNDFSMTFYNGEERQLFLEYVHNTEKAINWVNGKNITWTHAMVYERRSREKLDRIVNGE